MDPLLFQFSFIEKNNRASKWYTSWSNFMENLLTQTDKIYKVHKFETILITVFQRNLRN